MAKRATFSTRDGYLWLTLYVGPHDVSRKIMPPIKTDELALVKRAVYAALLLAGYEVTG